ncbi:hypothetical protein GCM10022224_098350 [Nonomuraea antimicrobica]|uniref:HTH cro/C1-type domain-containing protein n=1 Tax=Nonomuraea antimicrobica TaxID=561173 RepID=A0ABP7EBZ8_9ACTN
MVAMSRAKRADLARRARRIRQECERQGVGTAQVAAAIVEQLPDILPLEAWRLARGWSRPQALARLLATLYKADGRVAPGVNTEMLCRWEHGAVAISADYAYMLCRLYEASPDALRPNAAPAPAPIETLPDSKSVTHRRRVITVLDGSRDDEGTEPMRGVAQYSRPGWTFRWQPSNASTTPWLSPHGRTPSSRHPGGMGARGGELPPGHRHP